MDIQQLKDEIGAFVVACGIAKKPIKSMCLKAAYPGDSSTSYIMQIKANWVKDNECFDAIEFFTDKMFETMNIEARKKIFSIQVLKKNDELHCDSGELAIFLKEAAK